MVSKTKALSRAFVLVCAAACGFAAVGPAAAQGLVCPLALRADGALHRLNGFSVFDGPPAEMADLVPDRTGPAPHYRQVWDLKAVRPGGRQPYAICRYARTKQQVTLTPPVGIERCQDRDAPFHAGCF